MTKIFTCRFILKNKSDYKDLAPVFPDILRYILKENEHFQEPDEVDMREMYVELNMQDILENRKPEGYNRKAKYRLVFPMNAKEFYIIAFSQKTTEIKSIATTIGDFLSTASIPYEMKNDYTVNRLPGSEDAFTLSDHNTEVTFPAEYGFGKVLRANIKIKKPKKNAVFGYVIRGEFHEIPIENNSASMNFEIVDDISFGYQ
jgi:hypothetical protein